jgi:general secretion pathway protein L
MYWLTDVLRQSFGMSWIKFGNSQNSITYRPDSLLLSVMGKTQEVENIGALLPHLTGNGLNKSRSPKQFNIKFTPNSAIIRKLTDASLPDSRHRSAALLDMQAATPFSDTEFYGLNLKPANGSRGAYYAIVKRAQLNPLLDLLKKANCQINTIEFEDRGQKFITTQSALKRLVQPKSGSFNRITTGALAVCAFMIPVTFAHYNYQYGKAINQIESSIEPLVEDVKIVTSTINKRAARIAEMQTLRKNVQDRKPAIAIWEELARILPDTSFLTDLTITQNKVSIAGYSQSAAELIVLLEGSGIFDEVSFTAPVVKVPGKTDDRFYIDLKIGEK